MTDWTAVVYVTGKRDAATMRRVLSGSHIRLIVDARQPLVYSKWIDVAYLSTIRIRLWQSLSARIRNEVLSDPTAHWLMPDLEDRADAVAFVTGLSPLFARRKQSEYRRVWVLTNLDRDLTKEPGPARVKELLDRVGEALDARPAELRTSRAIRVGFFHEDLLSRALGFGQLARLLSDYFDRGHAGP